MYRLPLLAGVLAMMLAACGSDNGASRPVTPAGGTAPASPAGTVAVGELADRIALAWAKVATYREVTQHSSAAGMPATVGPVPDLPVFTEEAALPDRRRRVVMVGDILQWELISVPDGLFGRGPGLPGFSPRRTDPEAWLQIDPAAFADPQVASVYTSLAATPRPPYSALSPQERDRDAVPAGTLEIDGRLCQTYWIVDTTRTGDRIDITLALDTSGLPCRIITESGGASTETTFSYNLPIQIAAPAAATPVALSAAD